MALEMPESTHRWMNTALLSMLLIQGAEVTSFGSNGIAVAGAGVSLALGSLYMFYTSAKREQDPDATPA